jgi:hypothetical protein
MRVAQCTLQLTVEEMENIETFLEKLPGLTREEKLEIINQQWLLTNAPERSRARAIKRLDLLLERSPLDTRAVMATLRDVAKDLQRAIEEEIAAVTVISDSAE